MNENNETVVRLPDAACKVWGGINNPEDGSGFALTMLVGMFAVNDRTIYVEIPFSDFAPDFSKVADFADLALKKLRAAIGDGEETIERIPDSCWCPQCWVRSDGTMKLELTGLYRVNGSLSGTEIPFSEFAPGFASVSDFESIVVNCLQEWSRIYGERPRS